MKKVRMLLRVSSNQQLEPDGDLSVQREIVKDYVKKHEEWQLDSKEYFEGSNSGYKNSVADRNVLQNALQDAQAKDWQTYVGNRSLCNGSEKMWCGYLHRERRLHFS